MLGVAVLGALVGGASFVDGMRVSLGVSAVALATCGLAALRLGRP
jgi:hypothetical protein